MPTGAWHLHRRTVDGFGLLAWSASQVEVLAPFSALSAVVLIALICGSVVAQNAAAVVQAGPKLLAAIFLLHAGEAGQRVGWLLAL